MKIGVIGTGYVGLVQGVVLADFGSNVICMDINEERIKELDENKIPIFEPGLKEILLKNKKAKRIEFTTDIKYTIENSEVIFIAVGTPASEDGSADLHYVLNVAKEIGKYINCYKVIVDKSTVPVGTGKLVEKIIKEEIEKKEKDIEFDIVSNPEFLREGKAIGDCQRPDRVVIGYKNEKAREIMKKVYDPLYINETPFLFTNIETAELIKYASNSFLAVKISFINEIALLAEKVGANTQEIARSMGMDGRISPKFLHCGPGYGGSCFPKDTKAIVDIGKKVGEDMYVIKAAIAANEKQKRKVIEKIVEKMNGVKDKTIGILGLSFKPDTDDMRDAPSIDIIRGLVKLGAKIHAYCPEGMKEAKWRLSDIEKNIIYCSDEYTMSNDIDALVLVTEWNEFRGLDLNKIKDRMRNNFYFDLRNVHTKDKNVRNIFKYFPIGQE
ncbi:UDP-glucose/GDP-mannose dehydrogenase family protein [Fusobacterium sp.]|uniref:UDP-glucose dehydrogenase family protein n=1 Tax=Fusobacterium sp. TaxID=68766 RepID=UPI00262B8456|nr:UDP-glucose/GDP-mannose dehydrogenase family protein [Fusobacterium sp.]